MTTYKATIGTVSHATMLAEDLIPAFADELRRLDSDGKFAALIAECDAVEDFDSEDSHELLNESLFDALNSFAPPYCYFGAHPGDGSDYGYWPIDIDDIRESVDIVVDDTSEVPEDFTGEVLHVNDHGNCTLYSAVNGTLTEVWALV